MSKQRKWNSPKWACWFWDKVHHSRFYFQVLIWNVVNTGYMGSGFPILDYSVFLLKYFHSQIHTIHSQSHYFANNVTTSNTHFLFHPISKQYFTSFFVNSSIILDHVNTTLFRNILANVNDMVLLCLQNHKNAFLANGAKCWNLFTYSTKSSDSCFTIIYIRFVIQWPWVYNTFLFEWVHPENNVHQKKWSADGCIAIDNEWYYVYSYKLSQIA